MTPTINPLLRSLKWAGKAILGVIFIPLFLMLFFAMPADFCWSSWHLIAAQAKTTGEVVSASESVSHGRGGETTRSDIVYRYRVDGRTYESSRVKPGFLHNGYEAGGGEFAKTLHPGDAVTVHYSPWMPSLAFLLYGWPKWSIGFSMAVWGIVAAGVFCPHTRKGERPFPLVWQALIKPMFFTGFVVILFMDPVIPVREIWIPPAIHAVAAAVMAAYWTLRYPKALHLREPMRWLRPPA
jgi:hypothetical protein